MEAKVGPIAEGEVLIPVWVYDKLIRDSERLAMIENYLRSDKYSTLGTVEALLGVKNEKAGEE